MHECFRSDGRCQVPALEAFDDGARPTGKEPYVVRQAATVTEPPMCVRVVSAYGSHWIYIY